MSAEPTAADCGVYRIAIEFPMDVADEAIDALFTAVSDAAFDWEPEDRDGWDLTIYAGPAEDSDAAAREEGRREGMAVGVAASQATIAAQEAEIDRLRAVPREADDLRASVEQLANVLEHRETRETVACWYVADRLRAAVAPAQPAEADEPDCERCDGTGEQPDPDPHDERFYRCTNCNGTGTAQPVTRTTPTEEQP